MNHKTVTGYNITLDQALKQGGFYGPTGIWNSLVKIDGLVLRARVETLVIKKDLQQVYMHITNFTKKKYRIPGGSCEKDVPNYIQAMNECNEEARIKVKPSLINTGVHYIKRYKNPYRYDGIRKELSWVGLYTEVYVGEYDGPFTGKVDDRDKDDAMYKYGKFYPISEVYDILSDKHKEVIDDIFPVIKRSEIKEGTDMIYSDDNKSVHYYPYYTPREMAELGVHNESKNKYSDIQDDAIEWYHEYTDTLYNPDSENWLKELQERYDEYMLNPTRENQQLVLNLGWNLFVVPTLENVLMASKRTKEKLRLERERNNDVVITEEMIFTKKDIVLNIDDFDSGKSNILFITGLSGSGKTTMSSELCEQYAATKLSLDYFQNYHSIQNDPRFAKIKASRKNDPMLIWIDKYLKLNPEIKKQSHMFSNIDLVSFKDYFIPFFRWLISELKKDDDRYIIEGLHILLYIPYKDIKKYPLICINTSATKSLVRHWQRDDWTIKDIVQNGYDDILQFKRWNDMYTDFKRSIDESVVIEAAHAYEFGKSQNLYFVSELNMNDELLVPMVPDNYMTRNSFEDNITPRVCFSATIDGALMGLSQNIKGKKFYVHVPEDGQRLTIIKPAVASVPDQLITHEHWVMENVNLRCIGQIEITGDGDNEYEYTYKKYKYTKNHAVEIHGVKEYKAKLYDWKWRWIWKDDTDLTQENTSLLEGFLKSDKDIYYNKDKFDSGEINLCFITGHSGSGKSTMARSMQSAKVEHYELDDLNQNYKFTDDNLKEYGDLIYSFFKGPGKKYRYYSYEDMQNCTNPLDDSGDEFDKCINRDFVKYAMKYANSHKNTKFVIEGIWLYFFFKPEELKDYAVYIKGTSRVLSAFRAAKRDSKDADTKTKRFMYSIKGTLSTLINKYSIEGERLINNYRKYYENLQKINESYVEESSHNKVYHLSQTNLNDKTIQPTVPSNYMTKNGYEDGKTKRVCFATSIDGCLRGLSLKCEGMKLFVHVPDGNYNIYKPSNKEVPDASITGEVWIKKAVKMKCIGQIYVIGDKGEDGISYKYGDKTAELYDWEWKWIDKYIQEQESYIEEGYFKSTDNLEFNLDKWSKLGPHNLLYITGISGSGKTTLAKEICKKYKAEYIELDKFTLGIVKGLDRWFENVNNGTYEVHPLLKEYFSQLDHITTNGSWSKPDMGDEHTKFLTWFISKTKGNGTLYVVEGAQFFMKLSNMDPDLIKGEPLIIVGTSAFKSWVRRIKRDTSNDETISRFIYHLKKDVPMLFKYYFSNERDLQKYIKNIQSNINESSVLSITEKAKYSTPYTSEEIKRVYGIKIYKELIKDPAHKYRMDTGIELIHKEPTKEELERIWKNWNLMSNDQKMKSDKKSMELFGKTNQDHYNELINSYTVDESSLLENKKSEYIYDDLKTSKDIEAFQQCMMNVFGEEDDTSDKDIKKNMKAIRFNNKIIGYIGFSYYTIDGKNYLGIGNFMIIPQYQNHGHGTKIIADIIEKNRDKYDEIYCYVHKNNKKAIRFYKNIGHVDTSNLTKYGYYVSLYKGAISESSLLEMKRSELDDSEFGLPKLRKYPMPDKDHVLSAIRFFNYVSPENEKELARNIKKKMKQYNISTDRVGDKNRLKKYLTEDMDIVMDLLESLQFANFDHTKPALVFDLGSVLVDSKISFKETLYKSKLIPDDIVEELDAYIGDTYWNNKDKLEYYSEDEFYKYMIDRAPECLKIYVPAALKLQDSDLRLLDYSKTLIKKLKEKGYKLYYISNWSKWSKDKLTRSGFFDFLKDFDGGIFSGDVGHMKPDNAIF